MSECSSGGDLDRPRTARTFSMRTLRLPRMVKTDVVPSTNTSMNDPASRHCALRYSQVHCALDLPWMDDSDDSSAATMAITAGSLLTTPVDCAAVAVRAPRGAAAAGAHRGGEGFYRGEVHSLRTGVTAGGCGGEATRTRACSRAAAIQR